MYNHLYRKGPIGVAAIKTRGSCKKKRVKIGDVEYESISYAAKKLKTTHSTLTKYMQAKKQFKGMDIELVG